MSAGQVALREAIERRCEALEEEYLRMNAIADSDTASWKERKGAEDREDLICVEVHRWGMLMGEHQYPRGMRSEPARIAGMWQ